jgi:hypothetical protein
MKISMSVAAIASKAAPYTPIRARCIVVSGAQSSFPWNKGVAV